MTQYASSNNLVKPTKNLKNTRVVMTSSKSLMVNLLLRKLLLIAGLIMPFTANVSAQQSTIGDAIEKCSNESSSLQRLVCYDRLAKSMRQYSGLDEAVTASLPPIATQRSPITPSAPISNSANNAAVAPKKTAEQEFGLENKQSEQEVIDKLYASVSSVDKSARGRNIVTLSNGQVWRQNDSSTFKLSVGDSVFIERGLFGSFYLGKDDMNRKMKVKRDE